MDNMYEGIEFDLLSLEEVSGPNKLKIFDKIGIESRGTDLSVITSEKFSADDIHSYALKTPGEGEIIFGNQNQYTANLSKTLSIVNGEDVITDPLYVDKKYTNSYKTKVDDREVSVRPVIRNKLLFKIADLNKTLDEDGNQIFEYGEYPQKLSNKETQEELNQEFTKLQKLENKAEFLKKMSRLKKTGKTYTLPIYQKEPRMLNMYLPEPSYQEYEEYTYGGRKYIRYEKQYTRKSFDMNGVHVRDDFTYLWIEVKPLKWLVDTEAQVLVAKESIMSGVHHTLPFGTLKSFTYKYNGDYKEIANVISNYLDNHLLKDITPSEIKENKLKGMLSTKEVIDSDIIDKANREKELNAQKDEAYKEFIDALNSVKESSEKLAKLSGDIEVKTMYHTINVPMDLLIREKDGYREINPDFIPFLKYINLSKLSVFENNLKVAGIDFTDTDIILNPQKVWNKDLSNSTFSNDNQLHSNFDGVNLSGADISKEAHPINLDKAIIDEKTKLAPGIEIEKTSVLK